ncbi:aspartate kinase [Peribacillus deserti]|uniref:Aspartokinase n=1 Tax=Peribacillus deserti TaxID=673318 RepID=A0ABS2QFR4_9BACI|nr:aspartate kinase [Peribacillus deserti]MBM7691993.1 aspartate kinase [Peribacillus deserti]
MGRIVQKFGGTSVGSVERIKNAADRVLEEVNQGNQVVVVVSAMGKTTDHLVDMAREISPFPNKREMDMLLTTGEQITIALLSMELNERGFETISLTGWQAGVQTESVHGNARITNIETDRIEKALASGKIAVVAGFQGIAGADITTLGRGGSDTTAVALAAALHADKCDIYTDVTGVYTTDPRFVEGARKLKSVSYDEMLELANLGAGVLHPRAVEFAKNYQMPLEVRSSIERVLGTIIEEEVSMEQNLIVRGIAFEESITRISIFGLKKGISSIFTALAESHVNVDIIIQSMTQEHETSLSFSVKTEDVKEALEVLNSHKESILFETIETESNLAKVSIVGSGMVSNPGVAAEMFEVLSQREISIKMVSTSEIKVSTVVSQDKMLEAVNALHEAFNLSDAFAIK